MTQKLSLVIQQIVHINKDASLEFESLQDTMANVNKLLAEGYKMLCVVHDPKDWQAYFYLVKEAP